MSGGSSGNTDAVFVYSPVLAGFELSPDHPFRPERARLTFEMCRDRGLLAGDGVRLDRFDEPEEGLLETFHAPDYLALLERAESGREIDVEMLHHGLGTAENPVFKGVYTYSMLAATASVRAARVVAGGGSAFNPCGGFHHAHRDRASGFCYINDAVIAILELRKRGLRVAYVDIDAHHGDGVQEAFYEDPDVLCISVHESGRTLFPWGGFEKETGAGNARGRNINVPLEPETDDNAFMFLFSEIVMDALDLFSPEVIVGTFGTDTFATDPLTHLKMTNNGYIDAIALLRSRFPRIAALGGGGYNMENTVRGWTLLFAELAGREIEGGYGGALGGVFLGDPSIVGSDLRDMHVYTTGEMREVIKRRSEALVELYRSEIRPILA
jgi:acetoin utilization protein AcuC